MILGAIARFDTQSRDRTTHLKYLLVGDGEMGRWGDGDGEMGRWGDGDGEMGRWGDGERI